MNGSYIPVCRQNIQGNSPNVLCRAYSSNAIDSKPKIQNTTIAIHFDTIDVLDYSYLGSNYEIMTSTSSEVVTSLSCASYAFNSLVGCTYTVSNSPANGCEMYGGPAIYSCFDCKSTTNSYTILI